MATVPLGWTRLVVYDGCFRSVQLGLNNLKKLRGF